jgi:hypothetical protein
MGGTADTEPTATMTSRAAISWIDPSCVTRTRPRPTIVAEPGTTVAPTSSSRLRCPWSSGCSSSAARSTIQSRRAAARGQS